VTNRDDFLFTLVPQLDRRQQPDRRAAWRGSRRGADQLAATPLAARTPTPVLWTRPLDEGGRGVEKRILH
jgi:hypothetical protein